MDKAAPDWLVSGGELGDLIRAADWSSTSLGPRSSWPQSLRTAVSLVVENPFPMILLWAAELITLYNDACRIIFGSRHPSALGLPAHKVWPDAWPSTEPILSRVMNRGESIFRKDAHYHLNRYGKSEDAYFTLSDSPVRTEDGNVGGVLITLQETTAEVQRNRLMRELQQAPDGIFISDTAGRYIDVNEAGCRLLRCSREEILGKTVFDFIHEERAAEMQQLLLQLRAQSIHRFEWTLHRRDGSAVPIDVHAKLLSDGHRQSIIRDISERKRLERALHLAEARASGILAVSVDAIISLDDQQRITSFNEGAEQIFGYKKGEVLGVPLDILIPERHRAVHRQHVGRFAEGESAARRMGDRSMSLCGLRKDGEVFPAEAAISRLEVEGEQIFTVTLRDITEQKRIESEQQTLADIGGTLASLEFEDGLKNMTKVMVQRLADFAVLFIQEDEGTALKRIAAASRDEKTAWVADVMMQLPPMLNPTHPVWLAIREQRSMMMELEPEQYETMAQGPEHLRALRAAAPKRILIVPLLANGRCVGALGLSSASRQFEERDGRLAAEVGRRCALFVANARLHRAEKRATEGRDEVLGIVAHDLRNPLNAIILQAQLMQSRMNSQEERWKSSAEMIRNSAFRMNRLIEDLLDVARLDAGSLSIKPGRLAVEPILAEVLEAQNPLAAAASLELKLDKTNAAVEVLADRVRVLQIFENLIGNAIKFCRPGDRITVGAALRDKEVQFSVRDTGTGIPAENLANLFDRFWQAQGSDRRGFGLGLAIVKGLVTSHRGRIWVESALGQGTSFFFTLPTVPAALS